MESGSDPQMAQIPQMFFRVFTKLLLLRNLGLVTQCGQSFA